MTKRTMKEALAAEFHNLEGQHQLLEKLIKHLQNPNSTFDRALRNWILEQQQIISNKAASMSAKLSSSPDLSGQKGEG